MAPIGWLKLDLEICGRTWYGPPHGCGLTRCQQLFVNPGRSAEQAKRLPWHYPQLITINAAARLAVDRPQSEHRDRRRTPNNFDDRHFRKLANETSDERARLAALELAREHDQQADAVGGGEAAEPDRGAGK